MTTIDKIKIDEMVCVIWKDALGDSRTDLDEVRNIPPSQLLVETKTYGTVLNIDDGAITIAQESSDSGGDFTTIPAGMIIDIQILNKKMKGGQKNNERKRTRK